MVVICKSSIISYDVPLGNTIEDYWLKPEMGCNTARIDLLPVPSVFLVTLNKLCMNKVETKFAYNITYHIPML
jgi:hypothetical protein